MDFIYTIVISILTFFTGLFGFSNQNSITTHDVSFISTTVASSSAKSADLVEQTKKDIEDFMLSYSSSTKKQAKIAKFNEDFIMYKGFSSADKHFIEFVLNFGVDNFGPCFGIQEGNCRE